MDWLSPSANSAPAECCTRLTDSLVREIVARQFPALAPAHATYLGEGYDSWAFLVDGKWVFRFPKRADVAEQLLIETRVLEALGPESPLPLPRYQFHGRPCAQFPRQFAGYAWLPGVPGLLVEADRVPFDLIAPVVARFLSWLHTCPADTAVALGVERPDLTGQLDELREDAVGDLESVARAAPDVPLDRLRERFANIANELAGFGRDVALVHKDLAAEHVIVDPGTGAITGVIDWSEIAIADRAFDLAGVFHWGGEAFLQAVLAHYQPTVDRSLLARARLLAACRGAADVTFGLDMNRDEYVRGGLRALGFFAQR